ncbi:hypothetical protein GV792_02005 [Nocardia cyriacigeorgica]|nr:hypothetical protein [Nocardia cyriacigeorgica]NEW48828.1 hypothetical protein [Nocardia cyriacigeorgica]
MTIPSNDSPTPEKPSFTMPWWSAPSETSGSGRRSIRTIAASTDADTRAAEAYLA